MLLFSFTSRSNGRESDEERGNGRIVSLLSGRRSTSTQSRAAGSPRHGGLFGLHNSPSDQSSNREHRRSSSRGFFGLSLRGDDISQSATIRAAQQKVADAEAAEREADKALAEARRRVREARDHVKILEKEAVEEARRARLKEAEVKAVSRSAKALGRHG